MKQATTLREKLMQLFIILSPILVTQLALFSMSLFDIMMTGKYSSEHLAGVAVGSSLWVPISTGLSGILLAITPIVSHLIGGKKDCKVSQSVLQGVYVAIALALIIIFTGYVAIGMIINGMSLEPVVRTIAIQYLIALSFGIIPLFIYNVLRSFIDALGQTRVSMWITLLTLPMNIVLNYILIFGKLGFPQLGGVGAGIASSLTYWLTLFICLWIIYRKKPFIDFKIFSYCPKVSLTKWKEIFQLGIPIGLSIFIETSIFSAVTLFMSNFGTNVIAAHQAALNFTSFIYMIPLSISMALTILVGYEVGARRFRDAKTYSILGITCGVFIAVFTGILLLTFRHDVALLYSTEKEVVSLISQFLMFGIFFQLSDAVLAPIQGSLRGYKDVNVTFIMAIISFWLVGLPLGFVLANITPLEAFGYWVGLIIGLAVGAITLSFRLAHIQRKHQASQLPN